MLVLSAGALGGEPMNGVQRYTDEVVGRFLAHDPDAVVLARAPGVLRRWPGRVHRVGLAGYSSSGTGGNLARMAYHQAALPALLHRRGARAFYSAAPEGMLRPRVPQVLTVLDLLPLRYPELYPRLSYYYRTALPAMLRRSAGVVTISRSTADDLRERFTLDGVPVHVVYPGFRADLFRPAAPGEAPPACAPEGDFVLAVSEARRYKNFHGLVEAMARVRTPGLRLAVVGGLPDDGGELQGLPARLGIADRVVFLGRVSDAELAGLYRAARAMIVPSLWEGFGIPAAEAMASGCPLAVSRVASLPEVCGDAAVYFDPRDRDEMAAAIDRLAEDGALRAELSRRGVQRARRFSADRGARRIVEIVQAAAAGRDPGPAWAEADDPAAAEAFR